jgi:predicted amidohydrolase YtcJ
VTHRSTATIAAVLIAGTAAAAQRLTVSAPDAIFFNGRIIVVDPPTVVAEAFAVSAGKFVAVGRNQDVRALAGPRTRVEDLRGRAVVPGFIDNHNHQYHVALLTERGVDLRDVRSLAELLQRVKAEATRAPAGATVFTTTGWSADSFPEKRPPSRAELDAIAIDRPIVVYASRGRVHVNSGALRALGANRESTVINRVTVGKDAAGELDGVLSGSPAAVLNLTARIVPAPSLDEKKAIIRKVQAQQHAMGLTGIRELQLHPEVMRAYYELWRDRALTMRTSVGLEVNAGEEEQLERTLGAWGVGPGFGDEWLRIDGVAEYNPGEQLREPYADRPGDAGELRLPVERFREAIRMINRLGWRPAIHITGDRTLDIVLDAYEAADRDRSIRDRRWIVEHIPVVHADQIRRMKQLGVLVSAQFQPDGSEEMEKRLGPARFERAVPMRELLDAGLIVSGGSDWPGAPNNPFVNIYFYVTRQTANGRIAGEKQKITRLEALRVMTLNNAHLTFEENLKGSITAGKLADFVVLSDDPLTVPEDRLKGIKAIETYVGGRKVF